MSAQQQMLTRMLASAQSGGLGANACPYVGPRSPIADADGRNMTAADSGKTLKSTNTAAQTWTLWDNPAENDWVRIINEGTHDLTVDGHGTDTVDGAANLVLKPGDKVLLLRDSVSSWLSASLSGSLNIPIKIAYRPSYLGGPKDISQAVLRSANADIEPYGIAVDADGDVLVGDANADAVWGFRNGALHAAKNVSQAVLRSAIATIQPQGLAVDSDGDLLVLDSQNDAVWGVPQRGAARGQERLPGGAPKRRQQHRASGDCGRRGRRRIGVGRSETTPCGGSATGRCTRPRTSPRQCSEAPSPQSSHRVWPWIATATCWCWTKTVTPYGASATRPDIR